MVDKKGTIKIAGYKAYETRAGKILFIRSEDFKFTWSSDLDKRIHAVRNGFLSVWEWADTFFEWNDLKELPEYMFPLINRELENVYGKMALKNAIKAAMEG